MKTNRTLDTRVAAIAALTMLATGLWLETPRALGDPRDVTITADEANGDVATTGRQVTVRT